MEGRAFSCIRIYNLIPIAMRKLVFVLMLSLIAALTVSAHGGKGAFTKGNSLVGLNFGMKAFLAPHLGASYEYCILDGFFGGRGSLGVGGYAGSLLTGVMHAVNTRVALHNNFNNMDFYLGVLNGVNFYHILGQWNAFYGFDFFLGWRWAFNDSWGMNLELSPLPWFLLSQPVLSVGANFKF